MSREDFQFCHPFRVRYSEIDGQKVVFNAHYLTYFDTAITEYFRWLGFDYVNHCDETGYDFHTARTVVNYRAPIHYDEEIEVCMRVVKIGRSSLTFEAAIYGAEEENARATGEIVWVYIDLSAGKATPIDVGLLALLRKREGSIL